MILKTFAEFPPKKRIGILAVILSIIAIFLGNPYDKANTSINTKELALVSKDDITSVKVTELADWIIKNKYDYRLLDLRNQEEYAQYNIPTSENVKVNDILNYGLMRNEKIILYSDKNISATQAWFLLKAQEYKGVYILDGGIDAWQKEVLFPQCTCDENPTDQQKQKHNHLAEVAKFFGGNIQTTSSEIAEKKLEMPKLKSAPTIQLQKTSGKKKREGC